MLKQRLEKLVHPWNVKIVFFEGSLDVLLALIRNKKKQIADIDLTEICSPFLDYLTRRSVLDLDTDSSFIEVAATLILIKSNSLLPKVPKNNTDEVSKIDLEDDLKQQLLEHEKVRKLSLFLDSRDRLYRDFFCHPIVVEALENDGKLNQNPVETIAADIYNFALAYKRVLKREETLKPYIFNEPMWDVDGKIKLLKKILAVNEIINFFGLCVPFSKKEIITNLMAILELAKVQQLKISQEISFDDFFVTKKG